MGVCVCAETHRLSHRQQRLRRYAFQVTNERSIHDILADARKPVREVKDGHAISGKGMISQAAKAFRQGNIRKGTARKRGAANTLKALRQGDALQPCALRKGVVPDADHAFRHNHTRQFFPRSKSAVANGHYRQAVDLCGDLQHQGAARIACDDKRRTFFRLHLLTGEFRGGLGVVIARREACRLQGRCRNAAFPAV